MARVTLDRRTGPILILQTGDAREVVVWRMTFGCPHAAVSHPDLSRDQLGNC